MSFNISKDNQRELVIKNKSYMGFVFMLIGGGTAYFVSQQAGSKDAWVAYVVGGVFALFGLLFALYRSYGRFDFMTRQYNYAHGWVFNLKKYQGSFDQIEHLLLDISWRSSGSQNNTAKTPYWQVSVKFPDCDNDIKLFESPSEKKALNWLEDKAKKFQVKVIDSTDPENVKEKTWEKLDEPIANQKVESVDLNKVPEGIQVQQASNGMAFWIKAHGFKWADLPAMLLMLPFFVFGLGAILIVSGALERFGVHIPVSGEPIVGYILGSIFIVMSFTVWGFYIFSAQNKKRFAIVGSELWYTVFWGRRKMSEQKIPVNAIEELKNRASTGAKTRSGVRIMGIRINSKYKQIHQNELYIKSDDEIIVLRGLNPESSEYLANTLLYQIQMAA
ncbi:MAG: hypothetical protein MK008_13295 [Bdellovibrionales bacterium]|nr:hypothetical protein [Bdellovibrionales bacterium]